MNAAQVFSFANTFVLPGWLLLIFAPRWAWTQKVITGVIVTVLAVCYIYCIVQSFKPADMQSFSTLKGIMQLFTNETAVLAGWIHYLAFDLMIGLFETKNAQLHKMNHWLVVPCLLFTFMFGPVGLLLFFMLRMIYTKRYFAANYTN